MGKHIELVYFDGCPNAERARDNLRAAVLQVFGASVAWDEWDLTADSTPKDLKRHGSPTVLVDGRDVTGMEPESNAMACRADGAPSVDAIAATLSEDGALGHS